MKIKLFMCGGEENKLNCENQLGLAYLKSNVKNHEIEIVNNKNSLKDCDLIGLSSNAWGAKEAVSILNSTKIPVIIGGQITLWDKLKEYDFKHIVKGEGELALQKILNNDINEKIICEPFIKNIDNLIFPNRGKIRDKTVPLISSRGCPYKCNFCSSQNYWGKVRFHSANYFIEEIKHISKHYKLAKCIYILDDLFVANKKRLLEIHKLWMQNNFNKKYSLKGFVRSNIFDEEICLIMKEMGFDIIRFGAESGSNRMLNILNKQTTVENHQKVIDICKKNKIKVSASFMFNLPEESEEDIKLTNKFLNDNKGILLNGGRYKFKAFPGTKFYNGEDISKIDMRVRR